MIGYFISKEKAERLGLVENKAIFSELQNVIIAITVNDVVEYRKNNNLKPYDLYAGGARWLAQNTPEGELVFQTDWDDFPRLFFYNTHNTYLIGLDPTYMQLYDPELYDQWVDLTQGKVQQPSRIIRSRFGSSYAISDLAHAEFIFQAENDPGLREVYRDDEAVIFQVLAQP